MKLTSPLRPVYLIVVLIGLMQTAGRAALRWICNGSQPG